jgi:hypothetical protein
MRGGVDDLPVCWLSTWDESSPGGHWEPDPRVRILSMEQVIQLGLTGRVKDKSAPPCVVSTEENDIFPAE